MIVTNVPLRSKNFCYRIFFLIIKNEVIWGSIALLCCAIALVIIWIVNKPIDWHKYKNPYHEKVLIAIIAGIFAIISICMTVVQIIQHFLHKNHHPSQKRIIRILAIIPVYAITSWISIIYFQTAIYMKFIQSCFNAYVIYCFLLLLTKYLGGYRGVEEVIRIKHHIQLPLLSHCIKLPVNGKVFWYFKIFLLQYTWINPLCSGIAIVLNLADIYTDEKWKFNRGYPYIIYIINLSQIIALYSLITFYKNVKDELQPFKPLPKILSIQLIVFFLFWQSILVAALFALNILQIIFCDQPTNKYCNRLTTVFTVEEEKILLDNTLICVEMFFFSIAHHWIFSWKPYVNGKFNMLMKCRYWYMNNNTDDPEDITSTYS